MLLINKINFKIIKHKKLNQNFNGFFLFLVPDELGLGLTHEEWGDNCVVGCKRLESCGAYGDEFNGKLTGIGEIPDDWVIPEEGVDYNMNEMKIELVYEYVN